MELNEIDDDIEAFLVESYENLNQIEGDIIELEKTSANGEALVRIYRSLHTLKGNCGFLPFPNLESLAHAGENLLSCLRDRTIAITPDIISILLQTVDGIRQILSQIQATKQDGNRNYSALIATLTRLSEAKQTLKPSQSLVNTQTPQIDAEAPDTAGSDVNNELTEISTTTSESAYIRVNVNLLDQMMNLVGELVLARNQVIGFSTKFKDNSFTATCQHLSQLTAELQEEVMKTRLQPISSIWQKFPRVTRDLAIASGKEVKVEMEGADTELDKSIIETIKDPLTHLVRNCIDHGIELPAERVACGKPSLGRLFLKAFHESGKVNIEIGDDGRGLNLEQLKGRAQQLGLVNAVQAATMSQSEAMDLIFLSGFSTAEQVTHLSGRGVGMDIVKSNIEKINGTIEIYSQQGQGTTFKIKIPLTLAIIPALIVTSGGDCYAIPQASLQELVRLETLNSIEILYDVPVYRLRGNLVPLIYLNEVLQQDSVSNLETLSLVIVQVDNYSFGLVVDTIEDIQDIVVKPLGKQLKMLSLFAGATVLGDGTVALIIDVVGLANRTGIIAKQKQLLNENAANSQEQAGDRQTILLFEGPQGARMGIPLAIAYRLEEIFASAVEKVANQNVYQSYGQILPLIDLYKIFGVGDRFNDEALATVAETLQIIIVSPYPELSVGLVVDRILDIVEEPLTIKGIPSRPGVLFCAVIQGQITEIIDIETVIRIANPYLLQLATHG
ncbi:CheA signal transduction histidine kinases [Nostoc commune NIES-4072]|uniref:histidine kinase n=1 Tax=Nostoc commune NIES-4072 TaxID=2005467 RepID=A0A2R5FF82_NOSCO|nr:chemotaxis protein CheW [Nostoc commune]BBD65526.1 CheA signal transduction histidine kinases [Nostoc commune HK-02]GBG17150.1 CheA signal transduction histidine kinases [Nostoc commune NIES-4072]